MFASPRLVTQITLFGVLLLFGCGSYESSTPQNPLGDARSEAEESGTRNPLAARPEVIDPWLGSFAGDELSVDLRSDKKGGYRGDLRLGDQTYAFQAALKNGGLYGTFRVGGDEFGFVAGLVGDALELETGETKYAMTRGGEAVARPVAVDEAPSPTPAPAAVPELAAVPEPAATTPAPASVAMKSFVHPIGFAFQHPAAWEISAVENGLALIPDDAKRDAQGQPLEIFMVSGDDAGDAKSAADRRVGKYFDQEIKKWYPGLKRRGKTESLRCLMGDGTIYSYEGKIEGGVKLRMMVYVTIYNGMGIFLAHAGEADSFEARRPMARQMFSSFGWGKGTVDPELVGHWHRSETSSTGYDPIGGSIGATTEKQYFFSEDGTVVYSAGTRLFGTVHGAGGSISIDDPGDDEHISRGTWFVSGNELYMIWRGGGAETYEYSVFPHEDSRALKLVVPGETKPLFFRPV